MTNNYKNDEKELLKVFLDSYAFPNEIKLDNQHRRVRSSFGPPSGTEQIGIELIVRPECNQKCEYCYIARHGAELYPFDERVDNQTILTNLDKLLTYVYQEQKAYITRWELFAGDMFYDNLYFDIMDIFYTHLHKLYLNYPDLMRETPIVILAPVNFSFAQDPEKVQKMQEYIDKMLTIQVRIALSCSTDGKFASLTREGTTLPDEHWDNLLKVLKQFHFCAHPMLSPSNVDTWIENYDWWIDVYENQLGRHDEDFQPMILEVRNDEWTRENIQAYLKVLQHIIDVRFEKCHGDIDEFAYHIFNGDGANGTLKRLTQYDPIALSIMDDRDIQKISCSIQGLLHITLNNLSIVPCHRLTYKQFIAGQFVQDEEKNIIDVATNNLNAFLSILMTNANFLPKCHSCEFKKLCLKGCLGAQYEASGELFQPALTVCDMLKSKYSFLIIKYLEMGIIDSARLQGLITPEALDVIQKVIEFNDNKKREEEMYAK